MKIPLFKIEERFIKGRLSERPNRFTLIVDVRGKKRRAYLANPGRLSTVIKKGREILLLNKDSPGRKTSCDAFAAKVGPFYVTLQSRLANEIFKAAIEREALDCFGGYKIVERERTMRGFGRLDFVLERGGKEAFVEVKSSSHAEGGIAKFPDRPTERGRRHLKALTELARSGKECHLVIVIQRPDAQSFTPFKEVDPEFSKLFSIAMASGVGTHALSTCFDPRKRTIYLFRKNLPVKTG